MEILGQTIAHYHILEKLGEGGMGVVYKARDTKLDRLVALKFLPQRVTASETEQARFIQEAKASAALSHPNICPVHSIEEHEGEIFIVMDYIDGQTLRQKMASGQIPLKLAVEIGIQIAEGLGAAHEQGVVHRDVKPENIMIRKDGLVQVMDFGLAKLRGVTRLTKEGSTLGTIGYMSPEQVQGHDVDARTDIFSLGVVLYELVTGELPFKGEREAAITYQIVNVEAPLASSLRPEVSPELDGVIAECLAKDPEERYHFAKEVSRQLKRFKRDSSQPGGEKRSTERLTAKTGKTAKVRTARQPFTAVLRLRTFWIGIGGVTLLAALLFFTRLFERTPEVNPKKITRVLNTPFPPSSYPGLSSDGSWVAFSAADAGGKWEVYFMNTSGGEARRVTNERSPDMAGGGLSVSPDGSQIAYSCIDSAKGVFQLKVAPSLGGASRTIADGRLIPHWRPDGQRIGYLIEAGDSKSHRLEFWTIRPDGSEDRMELVDFSDSIKSNNTSSFAWSPDGRAIAWIREFQVDKQDIVVRDLVSREEHQITFDGAYIDAVCWARNNEILFSSNRGGTLDLWMVPSAGGAPVQITTGPSSNTGMQMSTDGKKMVFSQSEVIGHVWIASVEGSPPRQVTFDDSDIRWPSLSPDAKHIVFMTFAPSRVYVMDRDGTNRKQLTSNDWVSSFPKWSPDGKWISYASYPIAATVDSMSVYILDAMNPQTPRFVGKGGESHWVDDTTLIVLRNARSWLASINGGEESSFFEESTFAWPVVSRKYILFYDRQKNRRGLWIVSIDHQIDPDRQWAKKIAAADEAVWPSPNHGHIFLMGSNLEFWKLSLPQGTREKTGIVLPPIDLWYTGSASYDGTEIVYADSRGRSKLVMIENLFK
jgi:serine/threonine protein kinase